jgi:phage portal protein BeeE
MGLGDFLRWVMTGENERSEAPSTLSNVERQIARAIEERAASFTLADALALPAVNRAVHLTCSVAASIAAVAYRDGEAIESQPTIVSRPTPWKRPYDFVYETVYSLLAGGRGGDAYWLVTDREPSPSFAPRSAIVLDPGDVSADFATGRLRPVYKWNGGDVTARDLTHIRLQPRPGHVNGTSPLVACLPRLAIIGAAESYAAAFYESGGVPEVVLHSATRLDEVEAALVKAQYVGDGSRRPVRVTSGDIDLAFPGANPETSQMAQTRAYAATEVARLLGIPGALMLIETSGATITYTNPEGALTEFVRETLYPTYLEPLEQAWSDLVPGTQVVRFDLPGLLTADLATRAQVELGYVGAGVLAPEEVRVLEGWPAAVGSITRSPRYAPVRAPQVVRLPSSLEETA